MTVTLRLFAAARDAAGRGHDTFDAAAAPNVGALLDAAAAAYGDGFVAVLERSRVWLNGDDPAAGRATPLADGDEVAVLPPVSGGADGFRCPSGARACCDSLTARTPRSSWE